MTTPQDWINEAREWVGTPFHHQAAVKGVGCDCIGLMRGVQNRFHPDVDDGPMNYAPQPHHKRFASRLEANVRLKRVNDGPMPADFLLFVYINEPQHIGMYTERGTIIHAALPRVVEHRLDDKWRKRIYAIYRLKELGDVS